MFEKNFKKKKFDLIFLAHFIAERLCNTSDIALSLVLHNLFVRSTEKK